MRDAIGITLLAAALTLTTNLCTTRPVYGQAPTNACPTTYTETYSIGGRTIVCMVFVDCFGNVTRTCF